MLGPFKVATVLPSSDLERSRDFFERRLGLALVSGEGPLIFEAGQGSRLQIYLRPGGAPPGHTAAEFQVQDIASLVAGLEAKGVVFEDYAGMVNHVSTSPSGKYKMAFLKDPDGNFIALNEYLAGA